MDHKANNRKGKQMNKTVLFSPLGGTDPISQINCRDGSMLHICRHEKPDKVYLYLSKEMVDYEQKDRRYSYCLERLMELQDRKFEVVMIKRPDLEKVHDFDFFYPEFTRIIDSILREEMDETDTLILNISSGSPAMKSALAVIKTIAEFPCRLVQVTTPGRAINRHDNSDYDPVLVWECDDDNKPGEENRCDDVELPSLTRMKKEEIIKKLVSEYDYHAALQVSESMPANMTNGYTDLLKMAVARLNYDLDDVKSYEGKTGYQLPVKKYEACKRLEYALILQVKLKRKEYADYIRAITPLIVDLFEQVLKTKCGIEIDDYCINPKRGSKSSNARDRGKSSTNGDRSANESKKRDRKWSKNKLEGTEVLSILQNNYVDTPFRYGPISSDHLKVLIEYYSTDEGLKTLARRLRDAESNVRNLAAHEMASIDDDKIRELTGQSANAMMRDIRSFFGYTDYSIPKEAWDSYEVMNRVIIETM